MQHGKMHLLRTLPKHKFNLKHSIIMRIVFLIFVFVSISANSQIKNLNLELSSSYVTDLKIQENGLMWVGTQEGLDVFYDNERHVFYSSISDSTSILNSKVNKLFLSSV